MSLLRYYRELLKTYGPQGWWPIINKKTLLCEYHTGAPKNDEERFEICVGAILTQSAQWFPNVVRALQQLKLGRVFTREELQRLQQDELGSSKGAITNICRTGEETAQLNPRGKPVLSPKKILMLSTSSLKEMIRPAGYYNQKARKLVNFATFFQQKKQPTREELLSCWGIGPETADSILLYAFNVPSFVVDAYTRRALQRMGVKSTASYEEIKQLFEDELPRDPLLYQEYHALIVRQEKELRRQGRQRS